MFPEDTKKLMRMAKWIVGVVTACILIYLGVQNIDVVAAFAVGILQLFLPLEMGIVLALILNIPLRFFECRVFRKKRRTVSILLSLVIFFGVFIGVLFLIIPEFIGAVQAVILMVRDSIRYLSDPKNTTFLSELPVWKELAKLEFDSVQIQKTLEEWIRPVGGSLFNTVVGTIGSATGSVINFFLALVFAVYILSQKENLKRQVGRLIHVWLPAKLGDGLIHVSAVCSESFHNFIVGQTTEAFILGSLCTVGMLILRLPYAPMIGALVGVTALIPIAGAYIGCIVGAFMILTVSPIKALVFIIFLAILQQIEGNLIYPRVVGAKMNLPALWVLAALCVGGNLAGPLGMLISVPIASAAYLLLREATEKRERKKEARHIKAEALDGIKSGTASKPGTGPQEKTEP